MKFHIVDNLGEVIISNIEPENLEHVRQCRSENEVVRCLIHQEKCRRALIILGEATIYFCTPGNEVKSIRLFKEKLAIFSLFVSGLKDFRDKIVKDKNQQTDRLVHDIITYNGKNLHSIYNLIPEESLARVSKNELSAIQQVIESDPKMTARTLLGILKNENLAKSEISAFKKLYEKQRLEYQCHDIRKVLFLILNTFRLDFAEKQVAIHVQNSDFKVSIDYESVSAALTKVVENIVKYSFPKSDIVISFNKEVDRLILKIEMISLRVLDEEKEKIFDEGYSGRYTHKTDLSGNGIGLYLARELLKLNQAEIKFIPSISKMKKKFRNIPYENNRIDLNFRACK